RCQRRCRDPRRPDARFYRVPGQAVLPAPRRSRAGHGPFPAADCAWAGADARASRPLFGTVSADLRPRHSWWSRQEPDWAELSLQRARSADDRGLCRPESRLSAAILRADFALYATKSSGRNAVLTRPMAALRQRLSA